jgi:hypothetical protein
MRQPFDLTGYHFPHHIQATFLFDFQAFPIGGSKVHSMFRMKVMLVGDLACGTRLVIYTWAIGAYPGEALRRSSTS